jgi:DNA-binding winged helix-turn-helix (wHTH) protein
VRTEAIVGFRVYNPASFTGAAPGIMTNDRHRISFGDYELDCRSGELWKGKREIRLQPQPAKLLVLLASRPGEVVSRAEIQKALWGEDTFVDFEHGINFSIKQIREALGESAEKPRYLETVPRMGYRFIAAIEGDAPRHSRSKFVATDLRSTDRSRLCRHATFPPEGNSKRRPRPTLSDLPASWREHSSLHQLQRPRDFARWQNFRFRRLCRRIACGSSFGLPTLRPEAIFHRRRASRGH